MNSTVGNILPEGWKNYNFKEITNLITCGVAKRPQYVEIGVPFLSARNVKEYNISLDKYYCVTNETYEALTKSNKPTKGDILYSRVGSFGEAALVDFDLDFAVYVSLTLIKVNPNILYNKFLVYLLNSPLVRIMAKNSTTGIGVQNLNVGAVRKFILPIPTLEEQKRIVAKIDGLFAKIDNAISLTEESLKQAKNLLPSVLKEVFEKGKADGWEEKKLVDLKESNIIGLVRNAKQQSIDFSFEYVKMNNVTNDNRFTFNNITCVEANEKEVQKFKLVKGDFLFNTRNSFELVGKSCIYDSDKENVLYNNNLMRIRFKNGINPYFILYQFSSPFLISQLRNIKSGTTNVCAIYYHSLKDILLLVSSSDTQDKLVTYFNDVSKQAQQAQSKLEEQLAYLRQLKSSILSKAFKGEL